MKKKRNPKADVPVEGEDRPEEVRRVPLPSDPADVVPVPVAMSAAEIDERAKVVESLRRERDSAVGDEPRVRRRGTSSGDAREEP